LGRRATPDRFTQALPGARDGLQVDERPTRLAQAIAAIGRIDKTIHTLNFIDDEARRRGTLLQLNLGEGRHSLARDVFHGKRRELFQRVARQSG